MPPGDYRAESPLALHANTTLLGTGARLYNRVAAGTMLQLESGCRVFGLEIEGSGNGAYDEAGRGISIIGTLRNFKSQILLEDVFLHDLGGYGVYSEFAEHVRINRSRIEQIGYAGIMALSPRYWHVFRTRVQRITPGTSGNAYGISFTRVSSAGITNFPRAKSCTVEKCHIEDIPLWEGLDTHSGEDCKFIGNTVLNCKVGIALVSTGVGSNSHVAPLRNLVHGNTILGNGTGSGIQVAGAGNRGITGSWNELAEGNLLSNNSLNNCGVAGNGNEGAIYLVRTRGTIIIGNRIKEPRCNGVAFYYDNYDFLVTGNRIQDPWDDRFAAPSCVDLTSEHHTGVITGNVFAKKNSTLGNYVGVHGVRAALPATITLVLGPNENTCSTPYQGIEGGASSFPRVLWEWIKPVGLGIDR